MKLIHIELSNLHRSKLNVRKHGGSDVADLAASIRSRGLLQPLLVRADGEGYEVIAGQRRLQALQALAEEGHDGVTDIPCAVMEDGDDAAAIEASLAENIARLPMDEVDQYEAFAALRKMGRTPEEIARAFGVTERLVQQRLAIANLIPPLLTLYRKEEIGGDTLAALTLATKAQQKDWLAKFRDEEAYAPQGRPLKQWILGGAQIATTTALFDPALYQGAIVTDLFGTESYFADPDAFWALQKGAVNAKAEAYRDNGWEVVVLEQGAHWPSWDYAKASRKQGGRVYVQLSASGEAVFHEGFLPTKELRKREAAKARSEDKFNAPAEDKDAAPITHAARNYIDLHRHAAVQAALIGQTGIALRLIAAHMITGSMLWSVRPDPKRADKAETTTSLAASVSEQAIAAERQAVLALLGCDSESISVIGAAEGDLPALFEHLTQLEDASVLRILSFVMAESLAAGSGMIDTLGQMLAIDMGRVWQADETFLSLIRDRATLHAMLADIGGTAVAEAHRASPAKLLRSIILQYATGEGRAKVEGWVPETMRFGSEAPMTDIKTLAA